MKNHLAWFRESLITASSEVKIASNIPAFASKQLREKIIKNFAKWYHFYLGNKMVSSVP